MKFGGLTIMVFLFAVLMLSIMYYGDYKNKHFLDNHRIIEETCEYDISKCIRVATLYPKENRFFCVEKITTQEEGCPLPKWTGNCEVGNYVHCEWEKSNH